MNILDVVNIEGLWGVPSSKIKFSLDDRYNFIVGQNGTGKTTIINLLSAALRADFDRLDRIQFSRVVLTFKSPGSRKKPSITIEKKQKRDLPFNAISYQIKESSSAPPKIFELDEIAEESFYRGIPSKLMRERYYKRKHVDIQEELRSFVSVCWLSVNRHTESIPFNEDRRNLPAIDQKLDALNNEIVRYFSMLARRYSDHTREFQKNSFLSLLTSEKENSLIVFSQRIDLEEERRSLAKVFEALGVEPKLYDKKLETHLSKFQDSLKHFENNKTVTTVQFAAMYNVSKTHSLVAHYENLEKKRAEIFAPRDTFISVVNGLFDGRKTLAISEKNELVVTTKQGNQILIEDLSSGEKQLLIILGEALLQEESSVVYIADEPELSLHVSWQEQLTTAISRLNKNAQVVFATHSPDIVGAHSDKIINMEEVLG